MKIILDFDLCQGHAVCMGEAPDVFRVDEKGMLTILQESPPDQLRAKIEAAAKYCPTGAIRIEG
jgi:ferredoxin